MTQSPVQQRRQGRIELGESDEAQFLRIVGQFWGRGVARARIRGTIRNLSDGRRLIFFEVVPHLMRIWTTLMCPSAHF